MLDKRFLPSRECYNSINVNFPKQKKIAILMGVYAWCFNKYSITISGAKFIHDVLNMRSHSIHNFIKLKYLNYDLSYAEVLQNDSDMKLENVQLPAEYSYKIPQLMRKIGATELWPQPITADEIKIILQQFAMYLQTGNGFDEIMETLDFAEAFDAGDGEPFIRFRPIKGQKPLIINVANEFNKGTLKVEWERGNICENCGVEAPCVSVKGFNGQGLCNRCANEFLGEGDEEDCSHVECMLAECSHSTMLPSDNFFDIDIEEEEKNVNINYLPSDEVPF